MQGEPMPKGREARRLRWAQIAEARTRWARDAARRALAPRLWLALRRAVKVAGGAVRNAECRVTRAALKRPGGAA